MTWNPEYRDVPQPFAMDKLLKKAVAKLYYKNIIFCPIEKLKDQYGAYGLRFSNFLLVAKKKPYGNIISVHEEAVLRAMLHKIYIVIWLDSANKFYKINPDDVYKNSEKNMKGWSQMCNFNITLIEPIEGW